MLDIQNQEYFDEVMAFAEKTNQLEQFKTRLEYLNTYADHENEGLTKCLIWKDFASMSFEFLMMRRDSNGDYQRWFNGGLIYHGEHDNGGDGSAPTFSVNLVPENGWSIHT